MRKELKVHDWVRTLVEKEPYYPGYGGNPRITVPVNTTGIVIAVNVPYITGPKKTFTVVDFEIAGKKLRGNYDKKELKRG